MALRLHMFRLPSSQCANPQKRNLGGGQPQHRFYWLKCLEKSGVGVHSRVIWRRWGLDDGSDEEAGGLIPGTLRQPSFMSLSSNTQNT